MTKPAADYKVVGKSIPRVGPEVIEEDEGADAALASGWQQPANGEAVTQVLGVAGQLGRYAHLASW